MTMTIWSDIKITRRLRRHDIVNEAGERVASFTLLADCFDWLIDNGYDRATVLGPMWCYHIRLIGRRKLGELNPLEPIPWPKEG